MYTGLFAAEAKVKSAFVSLAAAKMDDKNRQKAAAVADLVDNAVKTSVSAKANK